MALNDATSGLPSLEGKVALVTGGSRGLGREMVLALARAGADVVIASRKVDSCEAVAAEVEQTTGRRTFAHGCHVGHWDELDALVDAAYAAFGHVDVLVNNAGMSPLYPDLVERHRGRCSTRCSASTSRAPSGWRRSSAPAWPRATAARSST